MSPIRTADAVYETVGNTPRELHDQRALSDEPAPTTRHLRRGALVEKMAIRCSGDWVSALGGACGIIDRNADAEVDVVIRIPGDGDPEGCHARRALRLFRIEPRCDARLAHLRLTAQPGFQAGTPLRAYLARQASIRRARRIDRDNAVRLVAKLHGFRESIVHEVERLAQILLNLFLFCHRDSFHSGSSASHSTHRMGLIDATHERY